MSTLPRETETSASVLPLTRRTAGVPRHMPAPLVRTTRVATRRARHGEPMDPAAHLAAQTKSLIEDGFGPYDLLVVCRTEHGDTEVLRGRATQVLTQDGHDHLLFEDGAQVPFAALLSVALELGTRTEA